MHFYDVVYENLVIGNGRNNQERRHIKSKQVKRLYPTNNAFKNAVMQQTTNRANNEKPRNRTNNLKGLYPTHNAIKNNVMHLIRIPLENNCARFDACIIIFNFYFCFLSH